MYISVSISIYSELYISNKFKVVNVLWMYIQVVIYLGIYPKVYCNNNGKRL